MFSLIIFFNFNSLFMFWIFLEINLVIILLMLSNFSLNHFKLEVHNQSLYYFIIQSIGSFLLVISGTFSSSYLGSLSSLIMLCSVILKMGIFPFHFWIYNICSMIPPFIFFILITMQKIPMFYLFFYSNLFSTFLLMMLNLMFGSYFIFKSHKMLFVLISSSLYSMIWLFFMIMISPLMFLLFFFNYCIFIYYICKDISLSLMSNFNLNKITFTYSAMFLLGLPPFGLFFSKFYIMEYIFSSVSTPALSFIWIFSFISTMGYFKVFYKEFLNYDNMTNMSLKYFYFFPTLLFFFSSIIFFL